MFEFLKKKRKDEDFDDLGDMPDDLPGEGKFPPPENAFDEPTPLSQTPKPLPPLGNNDDFPSMPEAPSMQMNEPMSPSPGRPIQPVQQVQTLSSDKSELIIAKIDSLKAMMEVLNQRLSNLEQKMDRRW